MGSAGEIQRGDLQVTPVNIALMERYVAIDRHLFVCAAALAVVRTFHHGIALVIREAHRAVFSIVDGRPNTCFGLDEHLISIGIELRDERSTPILSNGGVLVKRIGIVHGGLAILQREFTICTRAEPPESCRDGKPCRCASHKNSISLYFKGTSAAISRLMLSSGIHFFANRRANIK
ncbi:MAG: hypothetical protein IJN29_00435 [Akkermansia sp.]|nr:hypothetical protein [Akkermansia sp.]